MATVQRRSWWGRNWWWMVIASGFAVFLVLILAAIAAFAYLFLNASRATPAYRLALPMVQNDPLVINAIGQPISAKVLGSSWNWSSTAGGTSNAVFPIAGARGSGTVTARAVKRGGTWRLIYLSVQVSGIDEPIDIISSDADDSVVGLWTARPSHCAA